MDGKKIVGVFQKSYLRTWALGDNGFLTSLKGHTKEILSLDISKNGRLLVSSSADNTIRIWDIIKKKQVRDFKIDDVQVQQVRFSPNSKLFATAGSNGTIELKEVASGKLLQSLKGHRGKVNSIDFHPQKNILISGGSDKQIIFWDLDKGIQIYHKAAHTGQINAVRFSPGGRYYASVSVDRTVKIWQAGDFQLLHTLKKHTRGVRAVAFAPVKNLIASAGDDATIRIWDYTTGKLKNTLAGHDFIISSIHFSKDGSALVSASRDKTIRLWNVKDGNFIRTLSGESEQIKTIAVTPSGGLIAVGTLGHEINLLRLPEKIFQTHKLKKKRASTAQRSAAKDEIDKPQAIGQPVGESTQEKGAASKISDQDIEVEEETQKKDQIFDIVEEVTTDAELISLQQQLNTLLKKNEICGDVAEIETIAYKVLAKHPADRAAYFGLMKSRIVRRDLQMIFLMSKLGEKSVLDSKIYDFTNQAAMDQYFQNWLNIIFNQSTIEEQNKVILEFTDCEGNISIISMPRYLLFVDIPQEVISTIVDNKLGIDYSIFAGLSEQPQTFRDRLFALILAIDGGAKAIRLRDLDKYMPAADTSVYGYYTVDLSSVQQWGKKSDRVAFQLKRNKNNWMTFLSDTNKNKTLLLQEGNYYLRVNNRVRKAFVIDKSDQRIKTVIN